MIRILLFIILIFSSIKSYPQNLNQLYDSARINNDLQLAYEVKELAVQSQNRNVLGKSFYLIAYMEKRNGNYSAAIPALLDALVIFRDSDDFSGMADAQESLGLISRNAGLVDASLKCFQDALTIRNQIHDSLGLARAHYSIGQTLTEAKDYDQAVRHFHKSIKVSKKLKNDNLTALAYNNLGLVYEEKEEYKKANEFYFYALQLDSVVAFQATVLNNLGYSSLSQQDTGRAKAFFINALKLDNRQIKKRTLVLLYQNLGLIYENEHMDSAIYYNEKGFQFLKEKAVSMEMGKNYYEACKKLESLYKIVGNIQKSVSYDSLQDEYTASLTTLQKELSQLNIRYQVEAAYKSRLDDQTKILERQNEILIYAILLLAILLISLLVSFWLYYKSRKKAAFMLDTVQKAYEPLSSYLKEKEASAHQ